MKIGIDARMMGKGFGIARYIEQLVLHLARIDQANEYVLFGSTQGTRSKEPFGPNVSFVEVDIPWYTLREQLQFSSIIQKQKVDLMHFPHWNVPLFYNDPFVVTIHDLIMFHHPRPEATTLGPLKFWLKDVAHRIVIRHAVRKARCVITTSEFTKHDVHKTLGVGLEKMVTTYQAPFSNKEQGTRNKEQILHKYNVRKSFVMYVGAAYPHKNIERLVEAWSIFCKKYGDEYQLVLVGKEDSFWKRVKAKINNQSIIYTGFVPDDELSALYSAASLYVFPSLYEGFGLPPLEAMTHGVPVVSSNQTCLPEILGEAALYFDPNTTDQMVETIHKGLTHNDIRHSLRENAEGQLKQFSWEDLARKTKHIYEQQ